MNKLLFILLCCMISTYLNAQSFECEGRTLNVTDVVCMNGIFTFVVTAESGHSNYIEGLPDGFAVNGSMGDYVDQGATYVTFITQAGNGMFNFSVPSPGCLQLNLSLYMAGDPQGCDFNLLIGNVVAPIPTLSQWMIIVLAFLVTIFGVLGIRTSLHKKVKS